MRLLLLHIVLLLLLAACKSKQVEQPVLMNKSTVLMMPRDSMQFQSKEKNWEAVLLSFTQPLPLKIAYNDSGFSLRLQHSYGVTEGPAHILLSNSGQQFLYDVDLHNDSFGAITDKDYRSPKTVNPDSGLVQQQMLHSMDEWRNLIYTHQSLSYFEESLLTLPSTAGTFRAQKDKAITAYYVQPGSAVQILLTASYQQQEHTFTVSTNLLKDIHNNSVANGTNVAFYYNDGSYDYRAESAVMNGIASIQLPEKGKAYHVYAKLNETISASIQLVAP